MSKRQWLIINLAAPFLGGFVTSSVAHDFFGINQGWPRFIACGLGGIFGYFMAKSYYAETKENH